MCVCVCVCVCLDCLSCGLISVLVFDFCPVVSLEELVILKSTSKVFSEASSSEVAEWTSESKLVCLARGCNWSVAQVILPYDHQHVYWHGTSHFSCPAIFTCVRKRAG